MALSDNTKANIALTVAIIAALLSLPTAVDAGYRFFFVKTPAVSSSENSVVLSFVTLLSSGNDKLVAGASAYAAPGSPAFQYAYSRKLVRAALNANGDVLADPSINMQGDTVRLCRATRCNIIGSFAFDELDRVRDFAIDGVPVSALVVNAGESTTNETIGLPIILDGGYTTADGETLWLSLNIQSHLSATVTIDYDSFIFQDERAADTKANALGPPTLGQAQRGHIAVWVTGSPGGWLGFNTKIKGASDQFVWVEIR